MYSVFSDTIEHIQFSHLFHPLWTHIIKKIYLTFDSFLVEIPTYFIFLQISHTVSQILPLFKDEFHDFSMMYAGNNDLFLIEFYIFIIFFLRFIVLYVQAMLYKMFKKDEMSFFFSSSSTFLVSEIYYNLSFFWCFWYYDLFCNFMKIWV